MLTITAIIHKLHANKKQLYIWPIPSISQGGKIKAQRREMGRLRICSQQLQQSCLRRNRKRRVPMSSSEWRWCEKVAKRGDDAKVGMASSLWNLDLDLGPHTLVRLLDDKEKDLLLEISMMQPYEKRNCPFVWAWILVKILNSLISLISPLLLLINFLFVLIFFYSIFNMKA